MEEIIVRGKNLQLRDCSCFLEEWRRGKGRLTFAFRKILCLSRLTRESKKRGVTAECEIYNRLILSQREAWTAMNKDRVGTN